MNKSIDESESTVSTWNEILVAARNTSLELTEKDPVPHGRLSKTLVALRYAGGNTEAKHVITEAVSEGVLTASDDSPARYQLAEHRDSLWIPQSEEDVYPDDLQSVPQWVLGKNKKPLAPWCEYGTVDAHDEAHWTDYETVREEVENYVETSLGFVLTSDDDFLVVDLDKVRDPETGEVEDVATELVEMLDSHTDISTSGTGLHVWVEGQLPEGTKAVKKDIGDNQGSVEVYDKKRFMVMTGNHVLGTPTTVEPRQDVLEVAFADSYKVSEDVPDEALRTPEKTREELAELEYTTSKQDVFDTLNQLCPRDIGLRSKVTEERSDGTKSLDPSWTPSKSGTRIMEHERGWFDRSTMQNLDAVQMVALEEGIITSTSEYPEGTAFWQTLTALRKRGVHIPYVREENEHVLELPLDHICQLSYEELRRQAIESGAEWPTTEEVRKRLKVEFQSAMRTGARSVIAAPTASGKSHLVATTAWRDYPEITGGEPVVHLSKTRKARDEAAEKSENAGVEYTVLKGRGEVCSVARGEYDHGNEKGNTPVRTPDGSPASRWLACTCDERGVAFSDAHNYLKRENGGLPCGDSCGGSTQWHDVPRNEDGEVEFDVIHATHQFAYVPSLVENANVVFDELPDFSLNLDTETVRKVVRSYLRAAHAPVQTWEEFVVTVRNGTRAERKALSRALYERPNVNWYIEEPASHAMAPGLTRAILNAKPVGKYRLVGRATQKAPGWNASDNDVPPVQVSVVLTREYDVRLVTTMPALHTARSVIGLDAHPNEHRWQINTTPEMAVKDLLGGSEARLWRIFERGLYVIQVGTAERPVTRGLNLNQKVCEGLIAQIRGEFPGLRTAITSKRAKKDVEGMMRAAGISDPELLHYGEELSRNDFATESVGLLVGCIDPGDDPILDWCALVGEVAEPERSDKECEKCRGKGCTNCDLSGQKRAFGRQFTGEGSEAASGFLKSVRETHVAQSLGRYARQAREVDELTYVFAWTAAIPDGLVDTWIGDVRGLTDEQQKMIDMLAVAPEGPGLPTRVVAAEVGVEKNYVWDFFGRLVESGNVVVDRGAGKWNADLYWRGAPVHLLGWTETSLEERPSSTGSDESTISHV